MVACRLRLASWEPCPEKFVGLPVGRLLFVVWRLVVCGLVENLFEDWSSRRKELACESPAVCGLAACRLRLGGKSV